MSVEERFWAKVSGGSVDDCWLWIACRNRDGYATFAEFWNKPMVQAHRFAYRHLRGEIPAGLVLDHLCRTRHCVNPWHLEPVSNGENIRRGMTGRRGWPADAPVCRRGHPRTPTETYIDRKGSRVCRSCQRELGRAYRRRQKENQPV